MPNVVRLVRRSGLVKIAAAGVALLLGGLVLALVALELLCRAGVIENRAHQVASAKREGNAAQRVLVVGDSFSVEEAAHGPDSFGNLLATRLGARGVAVLNLSVSGTGPLDYVDMVRLAQLYGPRWQPDVVLVNYYVGNDVTDTVHRLRGYDGSVPLPPDSGPLSLLAGSHLLRFFQDARQERRLGRMTERIRQRFAEDEVRSQAVNPFLADMGRSNPAWLEQNLLLEGDEARRAWPAIEGALAEIARAAEASGARMVLNVFPATAQVDRSHHAFYAGLGFEIDPRFLTTSVPQDRLADFCRRERIECRDLLPLFRAHAGEELYWERDDHLNVAGSRLAADAVVPWLETTALAPVHARRR